MIFWKSIAIALAVILGLSCVGFVYVYSQTGGVGARQPRIVTLLRNQNVTSSWNASVNVLGYTTGFIYVNVSALGSWDPLIQPRLFTVWWQWEVDEIKAGMNMFAIINRPYVNSERINMEGSQMWFFLTLSASESPNAPIVWIVISMSLYLRD